ncbi:Protein EXECUTER 1, chloroplastic [Dichanthelium oligosanthes]|uniref:Protein EXECUTER 1, chloroplastic n=1 Tax=Dichanthelium oligosanthes TaxID=888268 RepID=A0A1E5VAU9_9POAL|nr:Protein EXECUTER 1, chloroplastic [Dichanthelium oligosanthes]
MASVSTAPRALLPAAASSSSSARQLDPNPSGSRFLAARRLRVVRRLAGAAPSRRAPVVWCSARSPDADASGDRRRRGWDAMLHDAFQGAVRRWSEYVSNYWPQPPGVKEVVTGKRSGSSHEEEAMSGDEEEGKWSWEMWKRHFALIEESERLVDELQLQLGAAVCREDYRSAHKLKLAIAATSKNDTVGRAISDLNRAVEEERYRDATYIRDHAGAGLLGWWSGISGNLSDPYGLIIRISAEHGRYVARSYDTRQLASDGPGFPIFEIYFAEANGGYELQAVHLKPGDSDSDQLPNMLSEKLGIDSINISSSSVGSKHEGFDGSVNMDDQDSDDSNITAGGPAGLKNLSSDSAAVPRIKILKVVPMENVNQDYIINIFDQISEEDDDHDDSEVENESSHDIGDEDNNGGAETVSAEENGDESGDENDIEALISIDFVSLYVTASGFDSEILSLQRKFGQWREDDSSEEHSDLLFYEYVEAVKLTGDNLVPAGQVVFRAKVGERYQLPHKGIIPRELGVVARYKGQRKIADPGFQNPRWVDGELLILDGKLIRDGPVIAFFYWTSNFHLFEFFRQLRLPD